MIYAERTCTVWQLASLAIPMIVMPLVQTVFMAAFAYFITFRIMGKDYEAAVMASASGDFGMGATPNTIANMQAITGIYAPPPEPSSLCLWSAACSSTSSTSVS